KPLACAAILAQVDAGNELLERRLRIDPQQIVVYSPITAELSGGEISLERACEAAITVSDNTAANLVLDALGGPTALTDFFRTVGDEHSRLDRTEPKLNEAVPGDPRDTTTPNAIVGTLETLVNGRVLGADSKQTLERWMSDNKVGEALFRSRLPEGWRIADKTGAGGYGSRALIALVRPSNRGAAFVAVYVTNTDASFTDRNEAIAEIGAGIFTLLALPQ
ncbi:MAG: class A beta-lactamase, partial [Pseudomonadota bacterium]